MAERPIIFSGGMVRAILDGRKTQTRRLLKPQPQEDIGLWLAERGMPYEVGDRLWVREAWATWMHAPTLPPPLGGSLSQDPADWLYKADGAADWADMNSDRRYLKEQNAKREDGRAGNYVIRPSIHMPRWASRITLEVTGVKVERLQEISEADAIAEGALVVTGPPSFLDGGPMCMPDPEKPHIKATPRCWYRELWDELHGPGAWDANPWVVAVTFRRIEAND